VQGRAAVDVEALREFLVGWVGGGDAVFGDGGEEGVGSWGRHVTLSVDFGKGAGLLIASTWHIHAASACCSVRPWVSVAPLGLHVRGFVGEVLCSVEGIAICSRGLFGRGSPPRARAARKKRRLGLLPFTAGLVPG